MAVWVVRAGENLAFLPWFESEDIVGIGWSDLAGSPLKVTRQDLADMLRVSYPDAKPALIANNTGQIWNFVNTIAPGDLVVVPLQASRHYRIGRIIGPAERRGGLPQLAAVRPVEWEARDVPASALADDLRNALGSIMTVFRPRASGAQRRLEAVIEGGSDPGPGSGRDRSGAWVFQANPKRFDLLRSLDTDSSDTWSVNQYRKDVRPGDRVWFRITGTAAGMYAVGRITSVPRQEVNEFGNWQVDVTFESRIEPPLLRPESDADPILALAPALTGLKGTNLALSAEADSRLEQLTEDRLVPIADSESAARLLELRLNLDAKRITDRVERDLLDYLQHLPPRQLEEVCALYLRELECEHVKVVGAAAVGSLGDGGIDVIGTLAQPGLPAINLAVQVKRTSASIGPSIVTQLRGSIPPGSYGMVITTGHFTKAAITEASRPDRNAIKLVDGPELAHVLVDKGIGVKTTTFSVPRLDIAALHGKLETEQD